MSDYIALQLIKHARENEFVIYMLTVYADDSADAKGDRIFAVAGIMGTREEWDALEVDWLTRTGGIIFHSTDCEFGYGDYKGISREDRLKKYADLTKLLANTKLMGCGIAIDVQGYNKYMPGAWSEGPYYQAFTDVIKYFAKQAYLHIPQQTAEFIFDINHKVKYNAAFLYDNYLTNLRGWEYASALENKLGFATQKTVGIQVVDLFAREVMKYGENEFGYTKRPMRLSLKALLDTNRFKCVYVYDDWFEELRDKYESFEQVDEIRQDFQNWLSTHTCQDNLENKIKYLIELQSKEKNVLSS